MKATGIVRRIDDLGRVVVPKEIRRTMRIREGQGTQGGEAMIREEVTADDIAEVGFLVNFSKQHSHRV